MHLKYVFEKITLACVPTLVPSTSQYTSWSHSLFPSLSPSWRHLFHLFRVPFRKCLMVPSLASLASWVWVSGGLSSWASWASWAWVSLAWPRSSHRSSQHIHLWASWASLASWVWVSGGLSSWASWASWAWVSLAWARSSHHSHHIHLRLLVHQ